MQVQTDAIKPVLCKLEISTDHGATWLNVQMGVDDSLFYDIIVYYEF